MSNRFATSPTKPDGEFRVTNGGTDALLAALCLAGEALARTPQQERLMIWLASQDQTLLGRGVAGFTLSELPWEAMSFGNKASLPLPGITQGPSALQNHEALWGGEDPSIAQGPFDPC